MLGSRYEFHLALDSRLRTSALGLLDELARAGSERGCKLKKRNNGRITQASLQVANVLLTESRDLRKFLLRQALLEPNPLHVATDQFAHIHLRIVVGLHILSLSTIICNIGDCSAAEGPNSYRTMK